MFIPVLLALLTNAQQLAAALERGIPGESFELNAVVSYECRRQDRDFSVQDDSGSVIISPPRTPAYDMLATGTRIYAKGKVVTSESDYVCAQCDSIVLSGTTNPPPVRSTTLREILSGSYDAYPVRTSGILRDYFRDELATTVLFLVLSHQTDTLYAVCPIADSIPSLEPFIGRTITLSGVCIPHPSGYRRKIGRILQIRDIDSIITEPHEEVDLFRVPPAASIAMLQPTDLQSCGRHRITGRVLAVWGNANILLKTTDGKTTRVELTGCTPPCVGDDIEVVGFPETDLYRINFTRALWRPTQMLSIRPDDPIRITAKDLFFDGEGKPVINARFHGLAIRMRGTVQNMPGLGPDYARFYLENEGQLIPIDISSLATRIPPISVGCVVDITGICVMDAENWMPNRTFPHIKEVMIVTRTPGDIVVIRRPPWWTPARLMIVIGSLLAVLIGILIWNRALKTLAEKRGKALANEELERLESDLKVCERTRLAVELHDSIAQNLTGVSMEIDTALRGEEPLPPVAAQHMGRALRTIDSCRGELRNCLWDLRSQALEEDDMNMAVRLTLSQTIGKANLSVRFNVPRSRFTDNTAHTLLRIIRELAANAVRHGHATDIKVAGSIEDNVLRFSVRDNGCGFDPDACPGVIDGHFGLQGIRERVASFEGNIQIESTPGKGTRVSVSINAPQTDDKEKI